MASSRLERGARAPAFRLPSLDGRTVSLSEYRGRSLWLAFFRYVACPLCNLRLHEMRERWAEIEPLAVLAVFQSPRESVVEFATGLDLPFPLLCDPAQTVYGAYRVETSLAGFLDPRNVAPLVRARARGLGAWKIEGAKTRVPADFLIDGDGVIEEAFYGSKIQDHIPIERPLALARSLRESASRPAAS